METEMVEPDRTIMIVSIIGLVVIWGSFFYHKFVQGGPARTGAGTDLPAADEGAAEAEATEVDSKRAKGKNKKKGR